MMALIFANHQQFEITCRKFIEKQEHLKDDIGPQDFRGRVQSGWKWHDHPVSILRMMDASLTDVFRTLSRSTRIRDTCIGKISSAPGLPTCHPV
jgi:hypothetical protein